MKNQAQSKSKRIDYRKKQKQQTLPRLPASLECQSSPEKQNEAVTSQAIDKEQALIVQINLHSRLRDQKHSKAETSITQGKDDRPRNNTPDKVIGSLLQSGIVGGKSNEFSANLVVSAGKRVGQH